MLVHEIRGNYCSVSTKIVEFNACPWSSWNLQCVHYLVGFFHQSVLCSYFIALVSYLIFHLESGIYKFCQIGFFEKLSKKFFIKNFNHAFNRLASRSWTELFQPYYVKKRLTDDFHKNCLVNSWIYMIFLLLRSF